MGIIKKTGEGVMDVGEKAGKGVLDVGGKLGKGVLKGGEKVLGAVDITCDDCGKLMKPGMFGEKRVVDGKEYQFCSVECADKYVEEHS